MLGRDARQEGGVVAADFEDDAAVKRRADARYEVVAPLAATPELGAIAEDELAILEQPIRVDAAAAGGHFTTLFANSRARASASGSLDGSFPPACAICGRPPPPPPATFAASRTQSPALRPFAIKSSLTAATNVTFPSCAEASRMP